MPPLIGYAATNGNLSAEAWALAAILFVWQIPHSLAIAWMYRDDYARAGIRMLPVIEPDGKSTTRHIVAFASTLIPVILCIPRSKRLPGSGPNETRVVVKAVSPMSNTSRFWVCSAFTRFDLMSILLYAKLVNEYSNG